MWGEIQIYQDFNVTLRTSILLTELPIDWKSYTRHCPSPDWKGRDRPRNHQKYRRVHRPSCSRQPAAQCLTEVLAPTRPEARKICKLRCRGICDVLCRCWRLLGFWTVDLNSVKRCDLFPKNCYRKNITHPWLLSLSLHWCRLRVSVCLQNPF